MVRKNAAIRFAAVTIVLMASTRGSGQENATFSNTIDTFASALVSSDAAVRPIRIAFLSLVPASSRTTSEKGFGTFFSERIAAVVASSKSRIRIFERQRLADILAEHELDASGAVDKEGAVRVGELAPVDAVFTGTYARTGETVVANARLVSVVTGEVLFARSSSIVVDDSIRVFSRMTVLLR